MNLKTESRFTTSFCTAAIRRLITDLQFSFEQVKVWKLELVIWIRNNDHDFIGDDKPLTENEYDGSAMNVAEDESSTEVDDD